MKIFDSHTHINSPEFSNDIPDVIERAHALDVTDMLVLADNKESNDRLQKLIVNYGHIYGALGCHPDTAADFGPQWEELIYQTLPKKGYVALGEIGLDYHCDTPHDIQKRVFKRQIEIAQEFKLPVSIHTRDAFADTYEILSQVPVEYGAIMHSFNGDADWAQKFLDLGFYLSYSGVVTFHNAPEVREAALATPDDRILVETDAPYLTPMPFRGRMNEPGMTRYTLEFLAQLRGVSAPQLAEQTWTNTKRILRIHD